MSELLRYILMRIINKSISDDVVQHFKMVIFELVQLIDSESHQLILFLNDSEKQIVLKGSYEILNYVTDYVNFVY